MTASTPIRQPLVSHNRRRFRVTELVDPLQETVKPKASTPSYLHRSNEPGVDNTAESETSVRDDAELRQELNEPIFRQPWEASNEKLESDSMWTLKRANPVLDSEDDEEDEANFYESPTKRSRQTLDLYDSLLAEGEPFVLQNYISFDAE